MKKGTSTHVHYADGRDVLAAGPGTSLSCVCIRLPYACTAHSRNSNYASRAGTADCSNFKHLPASGIARSARPDKGEKAAPSPQLLGSGPLEALYSNRTVEWARVCYLRSAR